MKIPEYLDRYIFNELHAYYSPGQNVDINLLNTPEENLKYIGTYFPRSFVESHAVFSDLLHNEAYKNSMISKKSISILDFGSGTGGNLLGLLQSFNDEHFADKEFVVYTVEGNENALAYQKKLVDLFLLKFNIKLRFVSFLQSFQNCMHAFDWLMNNLLLGIKFDIIMSFKCLGEFYNARYYQNIGAFAKLASVFTSMLKHDGIILFLDVTSADMAHTRPFTAMIMNNELREFVNQENAFTFIAPAPCAHWAAICMQKECFTQMMTLVEHSRAKESCKSSFKIIGHKNFAGMILAHTSKNATYQISFGCSNPKTCQNARISNGANVPSAFQLTSNL